MKIEESESKAFLSKPREILQLKVAYLNRVKLAVKGNEIIWLVANEKLSKWEAEPRKSE